MTALQQEPSAQAPWTRTMFGRALILVSLPASWEDRRPSEPGDSSAGVTGLGAESADTDAIRGSTDRGRVTLAAGKGEARPRDRVPRRTCQAPRRPGTRCAHLGGDRMAELQRLQRRAGEPALAARLPAHQVGRGLHVPVAGSDPARDSAETEGPRAARRPHSLAYPKSLPQHGSSVPRERGRRRPPIERR